MILDYEKLVDTIVKAMRNQAKQAHTNKAEVDISGGVDSAVVVALACKAFGPENVIGVYSDINSSNESKERARLVAEKFGFHYIELNLAPEFYSIRKQIKEKFEERGLPWPDEKDNPTIFGSFRSCIRAPVGRFVNRLFGGGIRQGTGNRDEDQYVRFYQKGGDGEVDCNWIEALFKGEVWELAEHLGVPDEIIMAVPTPDLWGVGEEHNDEEELEEITGVPLTYTRPGQEEGTIEWFSREDEIFGLISGLYRNANPESLGYTKEQCEVIGAIRKMEKATRHKAEPPPSIPREELKRKGLIV